MKQASIILLLVSIVTFRCNEIEECQLNPFTQFVVFSLKSTVSGRVFSFDSISMDNFGLLAAGTSTQALTAFQLPVDFLADQASYRFYTDSIDYFVSLSYQSESMVYEEICEPANRIYNLSIEDSNFPTIQVLGPDLDRRFYAVNVEITF